MRRLTLSIWAGALAGAATACADYGAHWLFMESAADRQWLLFRLLSLQPAAGAAALAIVAAVFVLADPLVLWFARRLAHEQRAQDVLARGLRALILCALLSVPTVYVALTLWSGGMMARLPYARVLRWVTAMLLTAGLGLAYALGARALAFIRGADRRRALRASLALFGVGFALDKLDQWVLPNLYGYLHAVLAAVAFGTYALCAAALVLRAWDRGGIPPALGTWGWALGPALWVVAYASVRTLDANQNVRVALVHTNMPHSRALMSGIAPLLPRVDSDSAELAKRHAQQLRERRRQAQDQDDLPLVGDAHVLLVTIDALRADHLGVYGYKRATTPEIDALAASGAVFEHAYAQAPHSSYSLCSLMTSEYLHETIELGLPLPQATLPRQLTAAGYHTAAFYTQGIFHTAGQQLASYEQSAFGFALHDHQDRPAEAMTDRVLEEIDRTVARGEPNALFWVHYFDVHEPYQATTFGTSDMDRYDSELLATDRAIGRLVRQARRKLSKPLIVAITADHGEEFREHGGVYHGSSVYEEQVHVPLIMLVPGLSPVRIATPVESVDITPTVLALLGIDRAPSMRGFDLRALLAGRTLERGPVFSAVTHMKMAVSWPYKLVADLRFGSFELYDLVRDPHERDNRADREPERVRALRGEVYAWLDSLTPAAAGAGRPRQTALERGRLGDRRAVAPLCALLGDAHADPADRSEAARLLGKLADESAQKSLLSATRSDNAWVAAEAAIALGRMFDQRAAPMLRRLVSSEDPSIRSRAAVSLARLRDRAAVPSLIEALWLAPNTYEREEAVRWLGRLGDPRALDPLLDLLPEPHTRYLVVVALGQLGDPRAFPPLAQVLSWDRNTSVRDGVVRALGTLGDPRGLSLLVPLLDQDSALSNTGESLVRLHAIERKRIGGTDVAAHMAGAVGLARCHTGPLKHDWDYQHRTYCTTARSRASFRLSVPAAVAEADKGVLAVLTVRRVDSTGPAQLDVSIDGRALPPTQVDGAWSEHRYTLPAGSLRRGTIRAELRAHDSARLAIDHLLLAPRTVNQLASVPGGSG